MYTAGGNSKSHGNEWRRCRYVAAALGSSLVL